MTTLVSHGMNLLMKAKIGSRSHESLLEMDANEEISRFNDSRHTVWRHPATIFLAREPEMKRFGGFIGALLLAGVASASNCPSGDALLKNNTPLASQCPNGFTSNPGALGSSNVGAAMQSQSSNVQMISAAAQNDGAPVDLALTVSYQEARFNSCACSQTGVKGPMQLTQQTAKGLG
ncbi:hypothetical protein CCR94_15885 [Rhodoblastus sphagnicola]|uniref:Transglycosylase SLT domain-containing protein n=2 Tax=Rhodoblastus sphagnicola TaxID=333368 RepID=A0A2S6N3U3_9HYPH|nr:hypothetical protein CCR94_15885 [Rhodoblastus sphagnicola]